LQQLRTFVGLKDWRSFSDKLESAQTQFQTQTESAQTLESEIEKQNSTIKLVETKLDEISQRLAKHQESAGEVREKIARVESQLSLNQTRLEDLDGRKSQMQEQFERAGQRTAEFKSRIEKIEQESETAELNYREASESLKELESELSGIDQNIHSLNSSFDDKRSQHNALIELITQIGRRVSAADSQATTYIESKARLEKATSGFTADLDSHRATFKEHQDECARLQAEAESKDTVLANARKQYDQYKSELAGRRERLGELSAQVAGLGQRAQVIEELEKSLEGINAGAKELLRHSKSGKKGPMSDVIGLVADLVSVNVQHAAIVDVALGEMAQFVVVDGEELINHVADQRIKLNGRVGLIQLDSPPTLGADPNVSLNGATGVIGRADRLVQVKQPYAAFIRQLLGGTWIVKTLGDALHLHANDSGGDQVRFVTLDGEIVESDGAVVVGPKSITAGLVSRRSELRALKKELERLEGEAKTCGAQVEDLTEKESSAQATVERQLNENSELASRVADQKTQAKTAEKQIQQTQKQLEKSQSELRETVSKLAAVESKLASDRSQLSAQELEVASITKLISSEESQSKKLQSQRVKIERSTTAAKVKLAKSEQTLEGVQTRLAQYQQEFEEQQQAYKQFQTQKSNDEQATQTANLEIEKYTEELTQLTLKKDELADLLTRFTQDRLEIDTQRRKQATELTGQRDQLRLAKDKAHQSKMRIEQLDMQREQLAQRLEEDYGIDIASAEIPSTDEEIEERDKIDSEISELRKKIGGIGSVNLDSLQELEELEGRYLAMDGQYNDLVEAKQTLEKIIARIDTDSRKLFVETLEAIRLNFQKLFRQTFGGGKADIILEPDVDPLEAGVEIIATPPGKPEFNNSLLSGGEKALTAVSLLMAIFQFRPSPFCVLDEVDAPFDEANIGRFIDVLRSFLGWTKFVIVTHSKKTMTAATTLYGITMQESGVSKRVSVRFEDVSEDGHISDEAINRSDEDAA